MNKKFFAALASATMAFTASGSIAVFADDFVEENTPSIDAGDLKPIPTEVVWNEANFGGLVKKGTLTFNSEFTAPEENEKIETSKLAAVTTIKLGATFEGEVKGLEYFTKLTSFDDTAVTSAKKVTNEVLDFSANTALTSITVKNAKELAEIKLPKADKDEVYHLTTLNLEGTKLTALDLSKQEALKDLTVKNSKLGKLDLSKLTLNNVEVKGNRNLEEVVLNNGKKGRETEFTKLDLSDNALETVNLDYINVKTSLNLSNNHIGALDLSNTISAQAPNLNGQTFYVSENAANVKLTEAFPELKVWNVTSNDFNKDTGVLTLKDNGSTTYTYSVAYNNGSKAVAANMSVTLTAANPMHRLYNPNSGEHFYTADVKEKEALVTLGWQDEGYGWVAAKTPSDDATKAAKAVYRLYNPNAGDHHYTMNENEVKTLVAYGWKDEGTGWYSTVAKGANKGANDIEVYRQYNPFANGAGSHNYTTDKAENDYLVSLGWTPEGTAWYAHR